MPRLRTSQQVDFQRILTRLQQVIDSPLNEIGLEFYAAVSQLERAAQNGHATFDVALLTDLEAILDLIPRDFGERFYFDAAMIFGTAESLSHEEITFNSMIVPLHRNRWGHGSLPMPSSNKSEIKMVDFVFFPGQDDLNDINLLSYPFLLHELGHNLFFKYDSQFREGFASELNRITNGLRLASIADQGAQRLHSQQTIEGIQKVWTPTPDHKNWAHELAIDITSLWLSGPAYLAALHDETDKRQIDPFVITEIHPPYDLRIKVLLSVGIELGWRKYCNKLDQLLSAWAESRESHSAINLNRYFALANQHVIDACASLALQTCRSLGLPKFDEQTLADLRTAIDDDSTPDFGLDLITAAWLVHEERGEQSYQSWQTRTVTTLKQCIRQ